MRTYSPQEKAFAWSYSKLKNYRTCPKRYYMVDVAKKYAEDFSGEHLKWGKEVHTAFERRVKNGTPFPLGMEQFEDHVQPLVNFPGLKLTEQQLAIKKDLEPCDWFAKDTWFRGIADFLGIAGQVALAIDYKTGKVVDESEQLALLAECIFSHYPQVQAVRTEFWWLKEEAATRADFKRSKRHETWAGVLPEVEQLEQAHKDMNFPPKQGGLCRKFCVVKECPHHGGG